MVILFARDIAERERCRQEHREYLLQQCEGVKVLSSLDLEAIPPFTYAHEHFGYRDRLSQPFIEGMGEEPTPGSGPPIKAGEFFLAIPTKKARPSACRSPKFSPATAVTPPTFAWRSTSAPSATFCASTGTHPNSRSGVAAKLMGRWRSGAPLVLSPDKDDPELGNDMQRNNNFDYAKMDPYGYGCPLGAHTRRMNPRDTAVNMQRRKMIRRGGTYGPPLPEDKPDDGIERGIAAFVGCASLVRQFEFAMNVWANDPNFHELGNERDPIFGTHDGTFNMTIPNARFAKKSLGCQRSPPFAAEHTFSCLA